ncbi:MAG: hypothetical protein QOE05_1194 [Actinomycetota bacterium]|nr:hypothetical protein [Actinomycetota bacterium]
MKRTAVLVTLALVAVSPAVAHAAPKAKSRTLTATYSGFYGTSNPAFSFNSNCTGGVGDCFDFSTVKGEKTVVISATDDNGMSVGLQVFTDDDFQGVQTYCGTATITVSPKAATPVSVRPVLTDSCAGVPTSGTLKAVLSTK